MDRVKGALTRRIGPLPAWAWALILGVVLYWYRSRNQSPTVQAAADTSAASQQAPQAPLTLQPGESAYDPNTGGLVTAPGGTGDGTGGTDPGFGDLISAIEGAIAAGQSGGSGGPSDNSGNSDSPNPSSSNGTTGSNTHGRTGRRTVGLKKGIPAKGVTRVKRSASVRKRLAAVARNTRGGRTAGRSHARGKLLPAKPAKARTVKAHAASAKARTRPTIPVRPKETVKSRPVATHPTVHTPSPAPKPKPRRHRRRKG